MIIIQGQECKRYITCIKENSRPAGWTICLQNPAEGRRSSKAFQMGQEWKFCSCQGCKCNSQPHVDYKTAHRVQLDNFLSQTFLHEGLLLLRLAQSQPQVGHLHGEDGNEQIICGVFTENFNRVSISPVWVCASSRSSSPVRRVLPAAAWRRPAASPTRVAFAPSLGSHS